MIKIKKGYNAKIVLLLVVIIFFLNGSVYGARLSNETHLRVPVGSQDTLSRIGKIEERNDDNKIIPINSLADLSNDQLMREA